MNIQGWFPCIPRDSQEYSPTPQLESINSSALSFLYSLTLRSMTTGKTIDLTRWTFVSKVTSLLFNMLSRLVIAFLPRNKHLLISWLQLFIIARTWKQPRCPSADEWIRKLWYIYTMGYYSAIKNNTFESVLMRWVKLEPITQSEVSQKDKHQYSMLTHIYGI